MRVVLDDLLDKAPNPEGVPLQLQIGGAMLAGAVRRSETYPGLYELLTVGQQGNDSIMVLSIFAGDDVQVVFVPHAAEPTKTKSGLYIPGVQ